MGDLTIDLDPIPSAFAHEVRKRLGIHLKELRLFGSRARGDAQHHSDYDMLVIVDHRSPDIRAAMLDIEVGFIDRYEALVTSIIRTEEDRRGTPPALRLRATKPNWG